MRVTTPRYLPAVVMAALLTFTAEGTALAAPHFHPPAGLAAVGGPLVPEPAYHPLVDLSAQRLALADLVAAAKWGTDSPIDDPAREQQVLDSVAEQARQAGADPEETKRIFRDQIEANKLVQRALHQRWAADPDSAPTTKPDLNEIRQEINRINTALVQAIAASAPDRSSPLCGVLVDVSEVQVSRERQLDRLHRSALTRSLESVCTG